MNPSRKPLHFNAFAMNTTSHIHHGQWRRADARQHEFNDVNLWIAMAKQLEAAKFDALFLADVTGLYGDADADWSVYVREGLQIPSNDPMVLVAALATHTEHLGLALTSNVAQVHPFQFARQISTLDHLSRGRIAWNVVTGVQDNGARNFGLPRLTDHSERYRWAEEYIDVAYKLWEGSWEDDALLADKARSLHADPRRIHKIHHVSERYQVEGPHLPSPSPQRTPLIFQAGSSLSGRQFAARHAEAVFIIAPSKDIARQQIDETRALAVAAGRRPDDLKFFQGLSFIIGSTEAEARAREEEYNHYVSVDGYLAHIALVDADGRTYATDTPLTKVATNGTRGFVEWTQAAVTDREPTIADIARGISRGTRVVGTPAQIADTIEAWAAVGVDGINVFNWVLPGSFEEFAEHVLPVLRARGLAQTDYAEGPLRQKLFGAPRLSERHPAARYRGAFSGGAVARKALDHRTPG